MWTSKKETLYIYVFVYTARLEAIASRFEAIALRLEAIALVFAPCPTCKVQAFVR